MEGKNMGMEKYKFDKQVATEQLQHETELAKIETNFSVAMCVVRKSTGGVCVFK